MIYFIQEGLSGNIKIGASRDPEERMKALQVGNSNTLHLIGVVEEGDDFSPESEWHDANKKWHIRGEWFYPHPLLLASMENQMEVEREDYERGLDQIT